MYVKSERTSAKREVQKERSARRDDQIARPRRAQTCARSARRECAREAGRFFKVRSNHLITMKLGDVLKDNLSIICKENGECASKTTHKKKFHKN